MSVSKKVVASLFGTAAKEVHEEAALPAEVGIIEPPTIEKAPHYRDGMTSFTTWIPVAAARQLKGMTYEEGRTVQEVMRELINSHFRKNGRPEIA